MDGVSLFVFLLVFGSIAFLAGSGRSGRESLRREHDARIAASLYRTTQTDATGMVICRRCGSEASERAGACPRCGALL